jgi:hypothetical protein
MWLARYLRHGYSAYELQQLTSSQLARLETFVNTSSVTNPVSHDLSDRALIPPALDFFFDNRPLVA